jgi:phosphatidylserine/phosphatidylglycerophosphate/cardiolipin synthase-like enzyme
MNSFCSKIFDADLYIGQNAGKTIEYHIAHAAKSIKIISPYLSEGLVQLLIAKQNQGVDVALLTSDDKRHFNNPENSKLLRDVIIQNQYENDKKQEIRKWILRVIGVIALACFAVISVMFILHKLEVLVSSEYFIKILIPIVVVEIILIVIWKKIRIFTYTYRTPFPLIFVIDPWNMSKYEKSVYTNNAFFHVKLFIIDVKKAFLGSVNLTTKGMLYNVESCIAIENQINVQRLSDYFDRLFDQDYFKEDMAYYGSLLYREPIN